MHLSCQVSLYLRYSPWQVSYMTCILHGTYPPETVSLIASILYGRYPEVYGNSSKIFHWPVLTWPHCSHWGWLVVSPMLGRGGTRQPWRGGGVDGWRPFSAVAVMTCKAGCCSLCLEQSCCPGWNTLTVLWRGPGVGCQGYSHNTHTSWHRVQANLVVQSVAPVYTVVGSHAVDGVCVAGLVMLGGSPGSRGTGSGGRDVAPTTSIGGWQSSTTSTTERTLWLVLGGELHGGGGGEHGVLLQQVALGGLLGGVVAVLL